MDVEVIYPYEPLQDDELCLKVGDIINQVECLEKGWCKGVLNKVSGVFPDNFVRLITSNRRLMRPHETSEMRPPQQPSVEKRELGGRRCRVVFSYAPQHEDELTLNEGDVVDIIQEVEEGWWKGLLHGKVGMFPSNFVEVCEQGDETPANIYSIEPRSGETNGNLHGSETTIPGKKEIVDLNINGAATGLHSSPNSAFHPVQSIRDNKEKDEGDGAAKSSLKTNGHDASTKSSKMQANAMEKERLECFNETDKITINIREGKQKDLTKHTNATPNQNLGPQIVNPPQLPPKPVRELARVLFPYTAEHDDELELSEGEVITILCKDLEDKGWWRGEIGGKVGVFPDNFVKIISSTEDSHVKPPRPEKRPNATPNRVSPPSTPNISPLISSSKEKEPTPPPPLPSKKVAPPPPHTDKKPHFIVGEVTSQGSNSHEVAHDNHNDEGSLTLTRETPLPHVSRPKGPSNRRPPSQFMRDPKSSTALSDENQSSDEEEVSAASVDSGEKTGHLNGSSSNSDLGATLTPSSVDVSQVPWLKELRENQKKKRLSEFTPAFEGAIESGPVLLSGISKTPPAAPTSTKPSPPYSTKPLLSATAKAILPNPVPHAREEIRSNKTCTPYAAPTPALRPQISASMTSSMNYDVAKNEELNGTSEEITLAEKVDTICKEFIPKMRALESRMEEMQNIHARQLKVLTKDLDDERKQRACLQIEVDRLKKLITTGYAQV